MKKNTKQPKTTKPARNPAAKPKAAPKPAVNKPRGAETKAEYVPVTIKRHRDKEGGHPHVILGDIDKSHVSVGLSTKPKKGKNNPNYALENDPVGNLAKGEKAYMRRQGTVAPQKDYDQPRKGNMTSKDHAKATEYGEKAKKKYLAKKNKKKQ